MFLKIICYFLFMNSISLIDAAFQRCDYITLPHGKVRYFNRARKVKLTCFKPFTLIGNSRLDCENGEWNGQIPICASKSCADIPDFLHGKVTYFNDKALAKLECDTDFTLIGSPNVVCDPSAWHKVAAQWNYTEIPECQANSIRQFHPCDYEPDDEKQCKWISKPGIFNWTVLSSNPKDNIHMPVGTFPVHDHTMRLNSTGHFLYLEALYAPTKKWLDLMDTSSAPARYMSPLFPPIVEDEAHCLIFYLYANGSYPGIVEVFSNEDSIWKSNGSLGTEWNRIKIPLEKRTTQFRITIEGKGVLGQYTNTAIDDLKIAIGEECLEFHKIEEEVHVTQTSSYAAETSTDPAAVSIILETELPTEQPDQFTTQQPESQVVEDETTLPPMSLWDHIRHTAHLLKANRSRTNNTGTSSWNSAEHFNFAANRLAAPTIHNRTTFNTTNHNDGSEETNTSSKTKSTQVPDGEIVITENNLIYHENSAENKANDIIAEQGVPVNSTLDHETDNESHIKSSATNLSPNESSIEEKAQYEKEKQVLNEDFNMLKNLYIPNDSKEVTNTPVTKDTHSTSILNTTVELNDAKYKQDYKEDEHAQEVKDIGNNLRHPGNPKVIHLQTKYVQNDEHEIENYSSHLNRSGNSIDHKMIWVISLFIICVLLMLFAVHGLKKYHFRNRRKDESSIRFIKKDDGNAGSPHKNDDILMLDRIPKKTA